LGGLSLVPEPCDGFNDDNLVCVVAPGSEYLCSLRPSYDAAQPLVLVDGAVAAVTSDVAKFVISCAGFVRAQSPIYDGDVLVVYRPSPAAPVGSRLIAHVTPAHT